MTEPISVAFSVDALSPRLTGIGRYCLELGRGLRGDAAVRRVSYFNGNHWLRDPEVLLENGGQLGGSSFGRRLANWRGHSAARGSIVHGPNYFLPPWADTGVVTVHDLSVLLYPETHPLERVKDFERQFQRTLDRAKAIITDSKVVRQEVITMLGIRPDRVFVVPLGISRCRGDNGQFEVILARYGLSSGCYTLCVSTFEPRKRIDCLVAAYELLPSSLRRAFPLVLVGASGWNNDALNEKIDAAQAAGWLIRLNFVSDAARDTLYRGARLFVYPSLYEGFGLPPVEAMLHGVPTMISSAATLVEVTRGAALVTNVDDLEIFASNLSSALQDDTWRRLAAVNGRRIANEYTWANCTQQTIAVYQKFSKL